MAKFVERIDESIRGFIAAQHIYFVGTAPLAGDGHVNVSPKGHPDTFVVLGDHQVAYLDLTASGIETVAHVRENSRITVMFCAFEGPPEILRLYGTGHAVLVGEEGFESLTSHFRDRRGARSVIVVDVDRISTSCGFAVPLYSYQGDRDLLESWTANRDDQTLQTYRAERNPLSIDGLTGFNPVPAHGKDARVS